MEKEVLVYVDLQGTPHLVGRLWGRMRKGSNTATFEYDKSWLTQPEHFSLEPALTLGPGPFHTPSEKPLFGAIGDSAPDRWGRVLMRRAEGKRAKKEGTTPRTLSEIDFLLMVEDEARQGALRFAEREGGPFLAAHGPSKIPPLIELPRLLRQLNMFLLIPIRMRICVCFWLPALRWAVPVRRHPFVIATAL